MGRARRGFRSGQGYRGYFRCVHGQVIEGTAVSYQTHAAHLKGAPLLYVELYCSSKIAIFPLEPSSRMRAPVLNRRVAWSTPTTAGMPYSRATTAPCVIIPPTSMIKPPAVKKSGVQDGSVPGQTMISPGFRLALCGSSTTRTLPSTRPGDTGLPEITSDAPSEVWIPS